MEAPTFLLLVLCVGVSASSAVDLHKRIHGGEECPKDERPYHVKVISEDAQGQQYICGGSLIRDQWVLTAAHCKEDKMYVVIGVHQGLRKPVEIIEGPKIYWKFVFSIKFIQNHDIMLLKLPHPVINIKPIDLPTKDNCKPPPIDKTVNIAGHGTYKVDSKGIKVRVASDKLLCVNMHVVDCNLGGNKCINMDPQYLFCAGNDQDKKEGKDTGKGDSGGGIIYDKVLHGIHLGGQDDLCTGPAIFLDICHYLDWIEETTLQKDLGWCCLS